MNKMEIYTDGSSLGNPGKGGWGAILIGKNNVVEIGEAVDDATNNQMELLAIYKALELLSERDVNNYEITLYSDSAYCVNGLNEWVINWQKNEWKKSDKKDVLNKDLWQDILRVREFAEVDNKLFFEHIKAHNGHIYNERVDDIARESAEGKEVELFEGKKEDYLKS